MTQRRLLHVWVPATAAIVGLSFLVARLFSWPLQKALFLAPIIVVCVGALAFLFVLWIRIALTEFGTVRHKRRWIVGTIVFVVLVIVLSILGVEIPKYE